MNSSSTFSASPNSWFVKPVIQPIPARECEYCLQDGEDTFDEDPDECAHPLYQDLDLKNEHPHFEEINISSNMEEYITHLYINMGSKTAYDALVTFLGALESKDSMKRGYVYFMDNEVVSKQEYARYLMSCIEHDLTNQKKKSSEKTVVSLDQDDVEPSQILEDYENIAAWNKLNSEAKEDHLLEEFLNPVVQIEEQTQRFYCEESVLRTIQCYKDSMKEERNMLKTRSKIVIQFAKNAVEWAHTHFNIPNLYSQQSIDAYIEERDLELKALVPEVSNYRLLTKKMKQYDTWEQLLSVIEVDHLAVGGSVTHEEQPLILFDTPLEQPIV